MLLHNFRKKLHHSHILAIEKQQIVKTYLCWVIIISMYVYKK